MMRYLSKKARVVIERQVAQMVRLVDDLMDVSRINHGKLELRCEQIELSWVINSAIESSRPVLEAAELELSINLPSQPIILNADLTRLAQAFINILNNAAKFTDPGGGVTVNVSLDESINTIEHKYVLISISDTGHGIAPKHLSIVFDAFTQLPATLKSGPGGLGVGLMLVKKIVELHNGSVSVYSEGIGLGATFTIKLPRL